MNRLILSLTVVFALAISTPVVAQSFKPVFEQNSVDGLLLGAEGSYKFFGWLEPSLGLAYGLQSQKIRYKAGLGLWGITLAALNWPGTPVLGRVGQTGLLATLKSASSLGPLWDISLQNENILTAFLGTLWPWVQNELPPTIGYFSARSTRNFKMPFGIELGISGQTLFGWWRLGALPLAFSYTQTHLSLRHENINLSFSYGTLDNEGGLPDFEFVQSVKGETTALKGDRFWALRFERRFDLIEIPLRLPTLPGANRPILERILVEGAAFLQLSATATALRSDNEDAAKCARCIVKPENLLSWGLSLLISLDGFKLRADIVFKRDGEYRLLFGS